MDHFSDGIFEDSPSEEVFKYVYKNNLWPRANYNPVINSYQEVPISKREILLARIAVKAFRVFHRAMYKLTGMTITEDGDGEWIVSSKDGTILEGYGLNTLEVSKRWERIELR